MGKWGRKERQGGGVCEEVDREGKRLRRQGGRSWGGRGEGAEGGEDSDHTVD